MKRKNGNNNSVDLDLSTLSGHLWGAAKVLRSLGDKGEALRKEYFGREA